ncbi:helix-turn-helix domain-containing protein [Nocardia sp. NPDC003482]
MVAEGSTLAIRALGRELRELRERADISQAQAARWLGISPETMGRLEEGLSQRSATDLYMNTLCDRYGVTHEKRLVILTLAQEVRSIAAHGGRWWRAHADVGSNGFDHRASLEKAATQLTVWQVMLVPEIVQTPDYRRTIEWALCPNHPTEEIEKRIEKSMARQKRLEHPGFTVEILLCEAVVRAQLGGPAVMSEQRRYLMEVAQRPNVSVRVVPLDAPSQIGAVAGSFTFLEFPMRIQSKLTEPPIVHVEGYVGDLYLERAAEVRRYRSVLTELRRVALSESDSSALILSCDQPSPNETRSTATKLAKNNPTLSRTNSSRG